MENLHPVKGRMCEGNVENDEIMLAQLPVRSDRNGKKKNLKKREGRNSLVVDFLYS